MIDKKVKDYLLERGCSFVQDEPMKDKQKNILKDKVKNENMLYGFKINKNGDSETAVVAMITKESDFKKQGKLFNIANYLRAEYALLAIDKEDSLKYYWFDVETSLPINETPEIDSFSEYISNQEDIEKTLIEAVNIIRGAKSISLKMINENILDLLLLRAYMSEKNEIDEWVDLDSDKINKQLKDSLDYFEIKKELDFIEFDEETLSKILYKMSNLPPRSILYNDVILSVIKTKNGLVDYSSSHKFKSVLKDIVKSLNIRPQTIGDLTSGLGFSLRDLAMFNEESKLLGVEINEDIANKNKMLNIITGINNITVLNEDSLSYDFEEKFDLIAMHTPFNMMGNKKNDYNFKVLRSKLNLSDAFVEQAINITKENGYIVTVVPEGNLFTRRSKALRELILEKTHVKGLIRLPNRTFNNTAIRTTVLVLQKKKKSEDSPENFFVGDIENIENREEIMTSFKEFMERGRVVND